MVIGNWITKFVADWWITSVAYALIIDEYNNEYICRGKDEGDNPQNLVYPTINCLNKGITYGWEPFTERQPVQDTQRNYTDKSAKSPQLERGIRVVTSTSSLLPFIRKSR